LLFNTIYTLFFGAGLLLSRAIADIVCKLSGSNEDENPDPPFDHKLSAQEIASLATKSITTGASYGLFILQASSDLYYYVMTSHTGWRIKITTGIFAQHGVNSQILRMPFRLVDEDRLVYGIWKAADPEAYVFSVSSLCNFWQAPRYLLT